MDRAIKNSPIEVGIITKPHGVRGVVKVHLYNKESTALRGCEQITLCLGDEQRAVSVQHLGVSGIEQLLQIEGIKDREAAQGLRGARVQIERSLMEPLEEGEYYCVDLLGCQVFDEENNLLGKVHQVFRAGESEVMVVHSDDGERMIPMSEGWVISVDPPGRRVIIAGWDQWEPQK